MAGLPDEVHKTLEGAGAPRSEPLESDVSVEERIELLAQIEKVVASARRTVTPKDFAYTPQQSGVLLPLLVNLAALLIIALAAVIISLFFNRQEQTLTGGSGTALAGETAMVSTIRREAENKVRSKDLEIGQIQGALEQTKLELKTLKADADAQVRKKEQELRVSFDAELAAERSRLQSAGASSVSIERQLTVLQGQLQASSDGKLAVFRKQLADDLAQKEAALTAALTGSQKSLAQAQGEKTQLHAQLDAASRAAVSAQGERARLAQELAALSAQGQREQLVLDQISSSYTSAGAAMKAARFDEALGALASLAAYLDQASVATLPAVQRRKTVDLFLIDALGKLVAAQRAAAQQAAAGGASAEVGAVTEEEQAAAPKRKQALAEAVASGDALYTAGNFQGAIDAYGTGLALLKDDASGMGRLTPRIANAGYRQGMADLTAREDKAARPAMDKADALARRGSYSEAFAAYAAVVRTWPDSSYVARSLTGLEGSLTAILKKKDEDAARRDQERKTTAGDKLAAVGAGLASAAKAADAAASSTQKELISLLDAKVKVKSVLGSDSIRSQYPGLADALDRYIQLFGDEKRAEGRAVALQDIGTVLDFLLGTKGRDALAPLWSRYRDQTERTAFQQLLDRLHGLSP